jgi:hypothetical protein
MGAKKTIGGTAAFLLFLGWIIFTGGWGYQINAQGGSSVCTSGSTSAQVRCGYAVTSSLAMVVALIALILDLCKTSRVFGFLFALTYTLPVGLMGFFAVTYGQGIADNSYSGLSYANGIYAAFAGATIFYISLTSVFAKNGGDGEDGDEPSKCLGIFAGLFLFLGWVCFTGGYGREVWQGGGVDFCQLNEANQRSCGYGFSAIVLGFFAWILIFLDAFKPGKAGGFFFGLFASLPCVFLSYFMTVYGLIYAVLGASSLNDNDYAQIAGGALWFPGMFLYWLRAGMSSSGTKA